MSSAMPNVMCPYDVNGAVEHPQWSVNSEILLPTHHQQLPTPQNILTSSNSSGSSGSSINTVQIPLEQLALNDQYATGFPDLNPHLVNNYFEPVQNVAATASNNNGNNWKPVTANGIAPPSSIHYRSVIHYPEPNEPQKPKRIRTAFTDLQVERLEQVFQINPYIERNERKKLAEELKLTSKNIKIWFQNRRMKKKNADKASKFSPPTTEMHPQNRNIEHSFPSVMTPQEYQTVNAVDVIPYANLSNPWNIAQVPSTSQESNIQPINGIPFSTNMYYTDQGQDIPVYQNLEGPSMRFELIAASTSNELQMRDAYSSQRATWIPDYSDSVTMEVQPHMQEDPH
ncbi:hypothetical protein MSG28_008120 [Choristoneura fumiferana]|uniref:Uncharacterized protein n=1 Tax=Choristoneura fumiferana TaxID=7141 RepID=A0ACC0JA73_CHOFU|nr:hypothetical protein MSG28_008120 [Choristoneura fumiferana]